MIQDWSVWHNYATYFLQDVSLEDAAIQLVESGLCPFIYISDGHAVWEFDNKVRIDEFEPHITHLEGSRARIDFPEGMLGFKQQCAFDSAVFRFYEAHAFSHFYLDRVPYIRAFTGPYVFQRGDRQLTAYPVIKIYQNGVLLVSFRTYAPNRDYSVNELIDSHINLYGRKIGRVFRPVNVAFHDAIASFLTRIPGFFRRKKRFKIFSTVLEEIDKRQCIEDDGQFEHDFVDSVSPEEIFGQEISISSLKDQLIRAIVSALNDLRNEREYIWLNQRKLRYRPGDYWVGRPNVFVFRYDKQPNLASDIIKRHPEMIGKIMARSSSAPRKLISKYTTPSLRQFEDLSLHINEAVRLVIYSKLGLNSRFKADPNNSDLILPWQVKSEFLDYVHMTYARTEERALIPSGSIDELLIEKENQLFLDRLLTKSTHAGEVREYFEASYKLLQIDQIRTRIDQTIALKAQRIQQLQNQENQHFGWIIGIIFGLLGVSGLSQEIAYPAWRALGWWLPADKNYHAIYIFLVFAAITVISVAFVWFWYVARYRRRI